ncbi:cytochrome-c peroxidase [Janthinobacterium lividum]|uniref:Cytochrome c peroxidase n=2 Tax=Janthinobacterium lividum TaxID=29581 RepID=A0ABU0XRK2_9BURK|nr:cytochrome c peroxidase [Janthinobacterium lividum]MDQ4626150.1 cytochrome c peroxidase [Janthinobacterium lividum]MDQ4674883.1 cytochrome c peroxidase [Janthinobacterium lividum]
MKTNPSLLLAAVAACLLAACHPATQKEAAAKPAYLSGAYAPTLQRQPSVAQMTAMGRAMFFEPSLSVSGKMSCASCHSPDHAYGPPNALAVQLGGPELKDAGTRAAPSLRYLQTAPAFTEHFHDDDGDDSVDAGPTGGRNWDGRAQSGHEQALAPLLSPREMGNRDAAAVVAKLRAGPLAAQFRQTYGADIFEQPGQALRWALMSLEVFQESPLDFYPYTSKYDAVLRKQAVLSTQEARGLALFNDERKGNCASCHISQVSAGGAFPQFTDYGLINIGVPRNGKLPVNADPAFFDMGLCGPDRTDLMEHKEYCGSFKTPSLRNVALRKVFFHNGSFDSLEQVLRFYVQRDTAPQKWYPADKNGKVRKYDDLPPGLVANVNVEAPFDRQPGQAPALNETEIADVIAFLHTLTDGYQAPRPAQGKNG